MKAPNRQPYSTIDASFSETDWRVPLLNASLRVGAVFASLWVMAYLFSVPDLRKTPETVIFLLLLGLLWMASFATRLPEALRLGGLQLTLIVPIGVGFTLTAPTPASGILLAVAVLLTTLFQGRWAGLTIGILVIGLYFAAGYGWNQGYLPTRETDPLLRPQEFLFWVRTAVGQILAASALVAVATYLLKYSRRTMAELRRQEQLLRTVVEASHDGMWDYDLKTGSVAWSDRVYEVLGVTRDGFGLTLESVRERLHPDDRPRFDDVLRAHLDRQTPFDIEVRVRRAEGSFGCYLLSGKTLRDGDNQPVRMVGSISDITAERAAADALRASESLLRQFVNHSPAAVAMFDEEMRYLQVNERWLRDYQLEGQDVQGRSHYEVLPTVPERWKEMHQRILAGATERCEEDEFVRPNGQHEWVEWEAQPWFKSNGNIGGMIMFSQLITEKKNAKLAHEELQARISAIVECTDDLIWSVDARNFGLLTFNSAFKQHFATQSGIEIQVGMRPEHLVSAAYVAIWERFFTRALSERSFVTEYTVVGGHRVLLLSLNVLERQGEIFGISVFGKDITAQKRAAQDREEVLERLRLALKAGHLGTFRRNVVTGEGSWDEQTARLMGRNSSQGTLPLDEFLQTVHRDDRAQVLKQMRSAIEVSREVDYSFRLTLPDGRLRYFTTHVIRDSSSGHSTEWITGVFQDISDTVEAQDRLKDSAQRLKLALAVSKLGVWQFDLHTKETVWDQRVFEIYNIQHTSRPPTHEQFFAMIVPEDRPVVTQSWNTMLAGGPSYRVRFRILRTTGEVRHIEAHASIRFEDSGAPRTVIGVNSDITDIVRAAEDAERLRVQVQQGQKMEMLGSLATGVAHDFNNLLTCINGFVDMAAARLPPGHEAGDLLKQALRGALNARDLVRRILDYSRTSSSHAKTDVDLSALIRDIAPLFSAALPASVTFTVEADDDVPPVLGDSGQLQQVVMNLCINSVHAIGTAEGTVTLKVHNRELSAKPDEPLPPGCPAGSYVCINVTDTGSGMDEATKKRIFEPFFTTKESAQGTGLGLSIVRDIVSGHQGGIHVESSPGEGTSFSVFLPAMVRRKPIPPALPEPLGGPPAPEQGRRILVVDDESTIVTVMRFALKKIGHHPEAFTSPTEAWKRFSEAPTAFDLLMLDKEMPEISGPAFVQRARELVPGISIIMMSGRFSTTGLPTSFPQDEVVALHKPFELGELQNAVNAALGASFSRIPM